MAKNDSTELDKYWDLFTEILHERIRFDDDEYMLVLSGMTLLEAWSYILSDPTYNRARYILKCKIESPYEDNTRIILAQKEAKRRKKHFKRRTEND